MKFKNPRLLILVILLLIVSAFAIFYIFGGNIKQVGSQDGSAELLDEYIITFEKEDSKNNFVKRHKDDILKEKKIGPDVWTFKFKEDKSLFLRRSATSLEKESGVELAEPNHIVRATVVPNDPNYSSQYHLPQIKGSSGWEMETGSDSTVIAVIDTGVKLNHQDLEDKIWTNPGETGGGKENNGVDDDANGYVDDWRGWDFYNNDNNPSDDHGHGTEVSGIATAETDNNKGVAGVNWSATIMPLKMLSRYGYGSEADLIAAVNYAKDNGADVVNMSLGGSWYTQAEKNAMDSAAAAGVVLVAAAGNAPLCSYSSHVGVIWPAAFSKVMAVGSVNSSDQSSSFSCLGPEVGVSAPGENIYTTLLNGGYGNGGSGTSFSSPQVAALAGLILAKYPGASRVQVNYRIIDGADKVSGMGWLDRSTSYGYGRINIFRSLLRIVKGPDDKIWVISVDGNTKHLVPDTTTFNFWKFSNNQIEDLDQSGIDAFATGSNIHYLIKNSTPDYYLVNNGIKKKFAHPNYLTVWGLSSDQAIQFNDIFINGFTDGKVLRRLARSSARSYFIDGGKKYPIANSSFYSNWTLPYSQSALVSGTFLALKPTSRSVYRLAKGSSSAVYLMDRGTKVHVTSLKRMINYGFSWSEVATVSNSFLNIFPYRILNTLVKGPGPEVYFMLEGKKRWIVSPDTLAHLGFNSGQIRVLSGSNVASLRTGQKLTRLVKDAGPAVYYVENHTIRHIPTMERFNQLGFSWSNVVTIPYSYLRTFPNGPDM